MTAGACTVGLVVHTGRHRAAAVRAVGVLQALGSRAVACTEDRWDAPVPGLEVMCAPAFAGVVDLVIVLGGDGTFLRAAHLAGGAPLIGVDLGRVGFLSEVDDRDLPAALERAVRGDFAIEERSVVAVEVRDAGGAPTAGGWALNEASVERTEPRRLVVLELRIHGSVFTTLAADAVICATPTGSTAYALSAGGPIVSPHVDAILVVPVAPHALFARSLVLAADDRVEVRPVRTDNPCVVVLDGREVLPVPAGGSVVVTGGDRPVRLARMGAFDFHQRVRTKFGLR